jgi:CDP-diacylglycerol--serine O-phosphatidyltransferase
MLRFLDAANAISLLGLACALGGMVLSVRGLIPWAVVALIGSGLCDIFDGNVARRLTRTDEQKAFGGHLDSLVDCCAFGMAPTMLFHAVGLRSPAELVVIFLFVACAVWRLAYFDTVGLQAVPGERRYYVGLPTTFTSLMVPLAMLAGFAGAEPLRIACNVVALGLAAAMVSPFKVPKPTGLAYPIMTCVALGLIALFATQADRFHTAT